MTTLTHASLFSGIGGFDLGFEREGFTTVFQCDNDKFCNRVLDARFPERIAFGDVTTLDARPFRGTIDVLSFGSPCQDLSVAGRRAGLAGARSGLFSHAARIIRECEPTFAIWENVPGAFSSNAGRDFLTVVDTMVELGARDVAWRVFDSRYAGVPQQRRRIYLVADFRGERAAEVLFESARCGGHPSASKETGQGVARTLTRGAQGAGRQGSHDTNLANTLQSSGAPGTRRDDEITLVVDHAPALTAHHQQPTASDETFIVYAAEVSKTLSAGTHPEGVSGQDGDEGHLVVVTDPASTVTSKWAKGSGGPAGDEIQNIAVIQDARNVENKAQNGSGIREDGVAYTLDVMSQQAVITAFDRYNAKATGEQSRTLLEGTGGDNQPLVFVQNSRSEVREMAVPGALTAANRGETAQQQHFIYPAIRRFTPVECERLQAFPDGWTCLCGAGADMFACKCPDGPRYRALGNAVTTTIPQWIARRIAALL